MYRHVPNIITIARLLLTIIFFVILNENDALHFQRQMWAGFAVFLTAALTDALDGYLARRWKAETAFGRVVDPFVDKILICGAFIFFSSNHFIDMAVRREFPDSAVIAPPNITGVWPWMAVVLIGREFLITSIRGLAEAQGMDFRADWAGKIKMVTQSMAVGAVLGDLACIGHVEWIRIVRDISIWVTLVVTVLSAGTYIVRGWRLFSRPEGNGPAIK